MRVFVTGATGYVGSAVVEALVQAGHEVTGLVRAVERARAVEALLNAARASGRPRVVVYTSGVWVLGHTGDRPADETAPTDRPASLVAWRPGHERLVLEAATDALATAVIRPGLVYGGTRGLVSELFASAVRTGAARYVGDGRNRWSLVHRADLAQLYRLVLERGGRGVFHGVDGVPVRVADAARAASEAAGRGGATQSQAVEEARRELGPLVEGLLLDQVVVARRSAELGWQPTRRSFLESAAAAYAEWRQ